MKNHSDSVEFEFDLPAYKRKDIKVEFEGNEIVISASKEYESKDTHGDFYRAYKQKGTFGYRSTLPDNINMKKMEVSFENGVLKVKIPKK